MRALLLLEKKWLIVQLSAVWLVWEVLSAADGSGDTWPLTQIVVHYLPPWLYLPAAVILAAWIVPHFIAAGRQLHREYKEARMVVSLDDVEHLDPATAPAEPVLTRATVIAVVTALIDLAIYFGLKINDDLKANILVLVGVVGASALTRDPVTAHFRHHLPTPLAADRCLPAGRTPLPRGPASGPFLRFRVAPAPSRRVGSQMYTVTRDPRIVRQPASLNLPVRSLTDTSTILGNPRGASDLGRP